MTVAYGSHRPSKLGRYMNDGRSHRPSLLGRYLNGGRHEGGRACATAWKPGTWAPMIVGTVVLVLTAAWHCLATWHFVVHPARTLGRATAERPISPIAVELFRFLGAMNAAFVALALLAALLMPGGRVLAFIVLALANASQVIVDLRVKRLGLARGAMFQQIMIGDAVFTAANLAALILEVGP